MPVCESEGWFDAFDRTAYSTLIHDFSMTVPEPPAQPDRWPLQMDRHTLVLTSCRYRLDFLISGFRTVVVRATFQRRSSSQLHRYPAEAGHVDDRTHPAVERGQ